jgi:hypothetical protein
MQKIIHICLLLYLAFYLFEGVVRFGLNFIGTDSLIFVRDIVLFVPLLLVFWQQFRERKLSPAFAIFAGIILVHGSISLLNIGSFFTVLYSIKILLGLLAGAVLAPYLLSPPAWVLRVILALWMLTFFGVLADKYFVNYPWMGMETTIGDIQVEISRNWEITGAEKRVGGFTRSSINVAIIMPLLALLLIFNFRARAAKFLLVLTTLITIFWTTQKGSIIGFALTSALLFLPRRLQLPALKIGISLAIILLVALPIILPEFTMPHSHGVFSFESFNMRVEEVWPKAWGWISRMEIFPFGVGLGGIGGAMRFYAMESLNYADNMFILLYAYFGVLSFIYIGFVWWNVVRLPKLQSENIFCALSIILFLLFYGSVLSIVEDQMAALFLGAAVAMVAAKRNEIDATK